MPEIDRLLREVPPRRAVARGKPLQTPLTLESRPAPRDERHRSCRRWHPLRPEWATLYNAITDLRLRNGLSRLVRIASFGCPTGRGRRRLPADVLRGLAG